MVGRAPRETRGVRLVSVDHRLRGVPGVRAGEARHAGRARAPCGRGGVMTSNTIELAGQRFDYADVLIDVMIGYACNVQCDYCSITDEMRQENMATAAIMAQLVDARAPAAAGAPPGRRKGWLGGGGSGRSAAACCRWCAGAAIAASARSRFRPTAY